MTLNEYDILPGAAPLLGAMGPPLGDAGVTPLTGVSMPAIDGETKHNDDNTIDLHSRANTGTSYTPSLLLPTTMMMVMLMSILTSTSLLPAAFYSYTPHFPSLPFSLPSLFHCTS